VAYHNPLPKVLVAIANQKGGVGKTNLTGNVAAELAARKLRVVAIDLDTQATLTTWLVGRGDWTGTADVLEGKAKLRDVLLDAPAFGVRVLASVPVRMRQAEQILGAEVGPERVLGRALRGLDADVVLMDCPPNMGIFTVSAILASTLVLAPVTPAVEALAGLTQLRESLEWLADRYERELPLRVVTTSYDGRLRLAREAREAMPALAGDGALLSTAIRENVALREAVGNQEPIRTYRPKSPGALDYAALTTEIFDHALS
jgi:chromosome partitioning protein